MEKHRYIGKTKEEAIEKATIFDGCQIQVNIFLVSHVTPRYALFSLMSHDLS